jgi:hypothetical protein
MPPSILSICLGAQCLVDRLVVFVYFLYFLITKVVVGGLKLTRAGGYHYSILVIHFWFETVLYIILSVHQKKAQVGFYTLVEFVH